MFIGTPVTGERSCANSCRMPTTRKRRGWRLPWSIRGCLTPKTLCLGGQGYTDVFASAPDLRGERLEEWFDSKTATFGGEDEVKTVASMFGNVERFDFGEAAAQIPKVDLPDLIPFFKSLCAMLRRRPTRIDDVRLEFHTPQEWTKDDFTIADRYALMFARESRPREGEDIAGIGLRVVDRALAAAVDATESLAAMRDLDGPLVVFALRDRITGSERTVRKIVVGMQQRAHDGAWGVLRDWEVLKLLNPAADKPRSTVFDAKPWGQVDVVTLLTEAEQHLKSRLGDLDLPFHLPVMEHLACLIPGH